MTETLTRTWRLAGLPLEQADAHGGTGVRACRFVERGGVASPAVLFMDYVEIPPGGSIGRHRHPPDEEEFYLILTGNGVMSRDQDETIVAAGDLVRNPPGGEHALGNVGDTPMMLFVFALEAGHHGAGPS